MHFTHHAAAKAAITPRRSGRSRHTAAIANTNSSTAKAEAPRYSLRFDAARQLSEINGAAINSAAATQARPKLRSAIHPQIATTDASSSACDVE